MAPAPLLVFAAVALLAACQQPQPSANVAEPVEQPAPSLPVPRLEVLDRTGILSAVAHAASAQAAGADDSAAQRTLDGRQFEFRIRFGCRGPSNELRDQWLGWSFDAEERTLRMRAMPTLSTEDALVRELSGGEFEAVEGFWIPRPWLLQPTCPAASAARGAPPETAATDAPQKTAVSNQVGEQEKVAEPLPKWPRIGIAQFFSETDPRTGRRSTRPYEALKTLEPGQPIESQGYDLVLSGRLKALPDRRVVACLTKDWQSPPECVERS
jgi:hypothetical protein